jgi:hypothetical protein
MNKKILVLVIGFLLIGFNVFAADGDLIVNGTITANGMIVNGPITANGIFPDYRGGTTLSANTVYQAPSNGYISVVAWGPYMNNMDIRVGSTMDVGTIIWRMGDDINGNTKGGSALIPIKRNTYFKIVSPGDPWISQYAYENMILTFYPAD